MRQLYLVLILLLCPSICNAKKETIWTADEDRIIVSYEIVYKGDRVDVVFSNVETELSRHNSRRYRKSEYIKVAFFDRTTGYRNIAFSGISPSTMTIPSSIKYTKSNKGYFFIEDKPTISFTIAGGDPQKVSIPLYLTYYEGRSEREIFSGSSDFYIVLDPSSAQSIDSRSDVNIGSTSSSGLSSVTLSNDDARSKEAESVYDQIEYAKELLDMQTKLPFSESLICEIASLRKMSRNVEDKQLTRAIQNCLDAYDQKKMDLELAEEIEAQRVKAEAEQKELEKQQELKAEQERIEAEQKKQAEEERKRSLWMTIGGVILAIVCFIGNQVLQHFRNLRSQRSMLEIQQDLTQRAEAEAKRHARNYTRRKVSDVVNSAKRGTQDAVRAKVNPSGVNKSKNKISI